MSPEGIGSMKATPNR